MSIPPTSTVPTALGAGRAVLRRPGATALAVAYLLGWVPAGMAGIAIMLLVRHAGGGDALAGAVAGAFAAAAAAAAPLQVELARQLGPARVLLASAGAFALAFGTLALTARSAAPAPAVAAWAVLAGLAVPPLPACTWALARRLGDAPGPDRRGTRGRVPRSGRRLPRNGGPAARRDVPGPNGDAAAGGRPGGNGSKAGSGARAMSGGGRGGDDGGLTDHDRTLRELPPPRAARVGAPSPRAARAAQAVGPLLGSLISAEPFAGRATGLWFLAGAAGRDGQDRTQPAARRAALGDGAWAGASAIPPPPSDALAPGPLPPGPLPPGPLPPGPLLPDPPWLAAALGDRAAPTPAPDPGRTVWPALAGARSTDPDAAREPGWEGRSGLAAPRLAEGTARGLALVAGPLLIGLLALVASPLGAALGVALLCPLGAVGVVAWSPTGAWVLRGALSRLPLPASVAGGLRGRGMPALLASTALGGASIGALPLAVAAFAEDEGSAGAAGLLIAVWGAGGLAAGLWHAGRAWAGPPGPRLVIAGCALAASTLASAIAIGLPQMGLALLLSGGCLGPWLLCTAAAADGRGGDGATTWVFSALTGGVAVGAALSGAAAALGGARPALATAVLGAAGAALVAGARRGTPVGPSGPPPSPPRAPAV